MLSHAANAQGNCSYLGTPCLLYILTRKAVPAFPKVFLADCSWSFIPTNIMEYAANEMAIQSFTEKDVYWVSPDILAAHMGDCEDCTLAGWVLQVFSMCVHLEILFQGCTLEIFGIAFPAWLMGCPVPQLQVVGEKLLVAYYAPDLGFPALCCEGHTLRGPAWVSFFQRAPIFSKSCEGP